MIDHNRKIIFIHIPKTAGTSIEAAFGIDMELAGAEKHAGPSHMIEIYGRDTWDEYRKFTVVRNPYDRALSSFAYHAGRKHIPVTSSSFVRWLEEQRDRKKLRSQVDYLEGWAPEITILRFETLEEDIERELPFLSPLPVINKTHHWPWFMYYNRSTARTVWEHTAEDFDYFGYHPDSWEAENFE